MIAFSKANQYFEKLNTCLIGLSVDSNPSHLAWMYDIYCKTGIVIPFPIIADRSGEIARKYGMISSNINNTATVRNVFIIDDKQVVRTILVYPMNIGRNISEILRIVRALQVADENNQMTPANWMPCEPMIVPMPQTFRELECRTKQIDQERNGMSWYLSFRNPQNCNTNVMINSDCNQMQNRMLNNPAELKESTEQNRSASGKINNIQNNKTSNNSNNLSKNMEQRKNDTIENRQLKNTNKTPERKSRTIQWNNFK